LLLCLKNYAWIRARAERLNKEEQVRNFWNMLLKENDKLESDLKCRVGKRLFKRVTSVDEYIDTSYDLTEEGEKESISGYGGKGLVYDRGVIKDYAVLVGTHYIIDYIGMNHELSHSGHFYIFYSEKKRKLVASSSRYGDDKKYEIGEDKIQILLRNLTSPSSKNGDDIIKNGFDCFIATAACGSVNTNDVIILSHFRDTLIEKYFLGKCFINFYYRFSPPIAKLIEKNNFVKSIIRRLFIHPIAKICKKYL